MARRSTIEKLPEDVRRWLERALTESGFSGYNELESLLREQGYVISKSANKDYWLPDVGEQVEVLLDANGEDGVILGAVYSDVDKPPFSDKNVRGTKYADGAEFSYNRATHTLTVKGGIERVVIEVAVGITLKGKTIDLTADTTTVNGNLEINGNAHSTGSMLSDGQNSNHHSH